LEINPAAILEKIDEAKLQVKAGPGTTGAGSFFIQSWDIQQSVLFLQVSNSGLASIGMAFRIV
jgi:hypothetical protein